jgi:hypothetical protein
MTLGRNICFYNQFYTLNEVDIYIRLLHILGSGVLFLVPRIFATRSPKRGAELPSCKYHEAPLMLSFDAFLCTEKGELKAMAPFKFTHTQPPLLSRSFVTV